MIHEVIIIVIAFLPDAAHVVSATKILATCITFMTIMTVGTVVVINVADWVLPRVSWSTIVSVTTGVLL